MPQPWNDSSILSPPVNLYKCDKKVDISALKHVCNTIMKVLTKQSPLHMESALCSRFLYKYDKKFRNDIGYRNFRKVHTALKKYLALNLLKDVDNFQMALPSENDDERYLPTKQMLEYVMLRIITFSMIMLRICVCSKQAAIFYLDRVKRGESHWMCLLPYALLSRLWSITMVLVQHSTTWYTNLYPFLDKLELKGLTFLPANYTLPKDLAIWLDLKNIDNFGRFLWDQKSLIDVDNKLLDDDDIDLFDNILNFVNNTTKTESEEVNVDVNPLLNNGEEKLNDINIQTNVDPGNIMYRVNFSTDKGEVLSREKFNKDQGQALSRDSFKVLLNTQNKATPIEKQRSEEKKANNMQTKQHLNGIDKQNVEFISNKNVVTKENSYHSHKNITNSISLKKFIDKEDLYRTESDKRSLTSHLSLMQWHALRKILLKLCDASTNRKVERQFQKIWKERCLYYK